MNKRFSAGGVVIGPDNKIIVVSQNEDSWSLPKGGIDPGETAEQAAIREIYEESGVTQVDIIETLGSYERPRIGKGGVGDAKTEMKHITMFLCKTDQIELMPIDKENPEAIWLDVDEVADKLTHKKDKEFFESSISIINKYLAT